MPEHRRPDLRPIPMRHDNLVPALNQIRNLAHSRPNVLILLPRGALLSALEKRISAESDYDKFLRQLSASRDRRSSVVRLADLMNFDGDCQSGNHN